MTYCFKASRIFWKAFHKLPPEQKDKARERFKIFRKNPYDPALKTHKIESLSARYKRTIHSITVESNLRAVFYQEGSTIYTIDIGTHDIYK